MKTFETEKNNIPEGATHYIVSDGVWKFCWAKYQGGRLLTKRNGEWVRTGWLSDFPKIVEIPKTELVEWKNGDTVYVEHCTHDEIKFIGLSGNNAVAVCECITEGRRVILDKFWVSDLLKDKPESPEEKEKRERLEAAYDLYYHVQSTQNQAAATFELFTKVQGIMTLHRERYLAIVDKTNYRKGE